MGQDERRIDPWRTRRFGHPVVAADPQGEADDLSDRRSIARISQVWFGGVVDVEANNAGPSSKSALGQKATFGAGQRLSSKRAIRVSGMQAGRTTRRGGALGVIECERAEVETRAQAEDARWHK